MNPSIVDGRSLVVLRQNTTAYSVAEKGILEHDGETLYLVDGDDSRMITVDELPLIKIVRPDSRIAACRGFDLFLIVDGFGEQSVAHGAAGRADSEVNVVRRSPVNGVVIC